MWRSCAQCVFPSSTVMAYLTLRFDFPKDLKLSELIWPIWPDLWWPLATTPHSLAGAERGTLGKKKSLKKYQGQGQHCVRMWSGSHRPRTVPQTELDLTLLLNPLTVLFLFPETLQDVLLSIEPDMLKYETHFFSLIFLGFLWDFYCSTIPLFF